MDSELHQSVYDFVLKLMHHACENVESKDRYDALRDTVLRAASGAAADTARDWNVKFSKLLLPPEVLSQCFSHLPLGDRVRISCVCRSWRSIAVSDPTLWTDYDVTTLNTAQDLDSLRLFISRSGTLPLDICLPRSIEISSGSIHEFIRENSARIRNLKLPSTYHINLELMDMRLLETICTRGALTLSTTPRLRRIDVSSIFCRDDQSTMPHLEYLAIDDQRTPFPANLFALCPNLTSLTLKSNIYSRSWPGPPAPKKLVDVLLQCFGGRDLDDYVEMFHSCSNLRTMSFIGSRFQSALAFYHKFNAPLYRLTVTDGTVRLDSETVDGVMHTVEWRDAGENSFMHALSHSAAFQTTRELVLSLETSPRQSSLSLPLLERLTVIPVLFITKFELGGVSLLAPELHTIEIMFQSHVTLGEGIHWLTALSNSLFMCFPLTHISTLFLTIQIPGPPSSGHAQFNARGFYDIIDNIRSVITDGKVEVLEQGPNAWDYKDGMWLHPVCTIDNANLD